MDHVMPVCLIVISLTLIACQQTTPRQLTQAMQESHSQQLASLIAGTRYLKYQCGQSELPGDGQIEQAAYAAAHQRGWQPPGDLAKRNTTLYQNLLTDSTPQAVQCAEFRQLLQPFITTLPSA